MGMVHWDKVPNANWVGVTTPFYFGFPIFEISAIISMCIVGLVIMTETTGDILAIGQIVDVKVDQRRLADGLRADGLSTVLGGVFNTFPYTAFAQNVGLVSITGVRSRYVATFAGGVLILLGLTPKMGAIVEGIPQPVLGGAGIALFGMVAASGVRTLSTVKFNNRNILVVAISVGIAMIPVVRDSFYNAFPILVPDDLPFRNQCRRDRSDSAQPAAELRQAACQDRGGGSPPAFPPMTRCGRTRRSSRSARQHRFRR